MINPNATQRLLIPRLWLWALFLLISLSSCQELGLQSSVFQFDQMATTPPADTLFSFPPKDVPFLTAMGEKAEDQLESCGTQQDCNLAHFVRGLTLITKNRDLASHHFRKVAVSSDNSPILQSSRVWIWILEETSSTTTTLHPSSTNLTKELIQALLMKDLFLAQHIQTRPTPPQPSQEFQAPTRFDVKLKALTTQVESLAHEVASIRVQSVAIQSLRRELSSREKKVEELTLQLDALRRIDQELKEKSTPTRVPETIIPAKDERDSTP